MRTPFPCDVILESLIETFETMLSATISVEMTGEVPPEAHSDFRTIATIGLGADDQNAGLTLFFGEESAKHTLELMGGDSEDLDQLSDGLGELSNLLAGGSNPEWCRAGPSTPLVFPRC